MTWQCSLYAWKPAGHDHRRQRPAAGHGARATGGRCARGAHPGQAGLQAAGTDQVTCDAAVLLTSETVTNAFVHGRSEARLDVAAGPESVHVEVGDDNSRHPTGQPRDEDALDGRGLEIVRMLAARWGVRDEPFGKVVWFEVRARPPRPA